MYYIGLIYKIMSTCPGKFLLIVMKSNFDYKRYIVTETRSETELDCYHQKVNAHVAKWLKLRMLGM